MCRSTFATFQHSSNVRNNRLMSSMKATLPNIPFIGAVFDVVAERLEHSARCSHLPTVEYLLRKHDQFVTNILNKRRIYWALR